MVKTRYPWIHKPKRNTRPIKHEIDRMSPSRNDFKSTMDIKTFCRRSNLCNETRQRIIDILKNGTKESPDDVDNRKVNPTQRIPRSLFVPSTPPGYWDIGIECPVLSL